MNSRGGGKSPAGKGRVMARTTGLLKKLPEEVARTVERLKRKYNCGMYSDSEVRAEIRGYITGLLDLYLLTESEGRLLICYITL